MVFKLFFFVCLLCFTGLFGIRMFQGFRGSDNMGNVMVSNAELGNNGDDLVTVSIVSPWKTLTPMIRGRDGVWRVPKGEKRVVAHLIASTDGSGPLTDQAWKVSSTSDWIPKWEPAVVNMDGDKVIISRGHEKLAGSLLPSRSKVLNWLGDGNLLWTNLRNTATSTILVGIALVILLWLWRAAAE